MESRSVITKQKKICTLSRSASVGRRVILVKTIQGYLLSIAPEATHCYEMPISLFSIQVVKLQKPPLETRYWSITCLCRNNIRDRWLSVCSWWCVQTAGGLELFWRVGRMRKFRRIVAWFICRHRWHSAIRLKTFRCCLQFMRSRWTTKRFHRSRSPRGIKIIDRAFDNFIGACHLFDVSAEQLGHLRILWSSTSCQINLANLTTNLVTV